MWRVSGKRFTIILFVDVIILSPLSKPKPPCWLFYKKEIILGSLSLAASAAEFSTRNGGLLHHPKDYKLSQVLLDAGARSKGYFSNLGLNPQWLSVLSPMWQTPPASTLPSLAFVALRYSHVTTVPKFAAATTTTTTKVEVFVFDSMLQIHSGLRSGMPIKIFLRVKKKKEKKKKSSFKTVSSFAIVDCMVVRSLWSPANPTKKWL